MIHSVKVRRQSSMDFYAHYEQLCALEGCAPLTSVKAKKLYNILDINADRIKAADWIPLLRAVRHNKTLTFIAIKSCHHQGPGDSGFEKHGTGIRRRIPAIRSKDLTGQLCKAIKGCLMVSKALGNLELHGLLLREKDLILLTKGLADTSSLERLSLAHSPIGDGGLEIICQSVKNSSCIKSIDFTGCSLTWRGAEHMASILKHQAMQRHGEAWAESLRYRRPDFDCMAGLRRITLNCNALIGDRGAAVLADCLAEDLWLKALDLQQCGISSEGAKSLLDSFKSNRTLVVLDIRKNPLVDHALMKKIMEKILMNAKGANLEYKWLPSPLSKDVKNKPKKRTVVLGNGRKGKATIRIGFSSKKSPSSGKTISWDQDNYAPKPLPPGTRGFLPWRTAERAKHHRASSEKSTHEFPLQIQTGIPVTVTVESASASETETESTMDNVICRNDATESSKLTNLKQWHQFQMEYEECHLKLKEERKARMIAEERIMEVELENTQLRNINCSLSEAVHAQSVASTILEDEGVLKSIENSFQKFHAFLDLLKDAGLGQLAAMAGIDQSDFGVLHHSQMTSTVKPTVIESEKSFEEERQEHMQNFKNGGSTSFQNPLIFQKVFDSCQAVSSDPPATAKTHDCQGVGPSQQSLWQDIEAKIDSWRIEDHESKPTQTASEKNSQPLELETRHSSVRQILTTRLSVSEPVINVLGNKFAAPVVENSKVSSKKLSYTTGFTTEDKNLQQTDLSRNDTVESDSEIQESIHSVESS
ncbi:centrosomal protein of 78 kDa [Erythrolamprus reginae]|uniref:centrosomal protein of 78 kDa n=1 Tax=Erythrolamprus reginae TaxID=121349 RepID=UPI00396CCAAB